MCRDNDNQKQIINKTQKQIKLENTRTATRTLSFNLITCPVFNLLGITRGEHQS